MKKFRCLIFEHKIKAVIGVFGEYCGTFRGDPGEAKWVKIETFCGFDSSKKTPLVVQSKKAD